MKIPMVLHKKIFFMRFFFVFVLLFAYAHCNHVRKRASNGTIKSMIVQEIMKKVSNITLNTLSKAPAEKRETILHKIETKLRNSAKSMGPEVNKYVKFIMDEFKTKAFKKERANANSTRNVKKSLQSLRTKKKDRVVSRTATDLQMKQEIIKDIANKIQSLAKGLMRDITTIEKKKEVLEKIKNKIMATANQKHIQIHHKHDELKAYSSLISQGLEMSIQQLLTDDARRMEVEEQLRTQEDEIDMIAQEDTTDKIVQEDETHNITMEDNNKAEDAILKKFDFEFDIDEINKYKKLISHSMNASSLDPHCDEILEETCAKIQSFNKINCGDGKTVPIENLCNGVVDCWNQVDEINCTVQAKEKVKEATAVMSEVEESLTGKCFVIDTFQDHMPTSQNEILRDVLHTQMGFLEKNLAAPLTDTGDKGLDDVFIKKTVSDVSMILSTLSYALDGTICGHRVKPEHKASGRKYNDIEIDEVEDGPQDARWSPKLCFCKEQYCRDGDCESPCKRVCWQKYSLNHWGCQAINGGTSVSLNFICDGKLDCFDETDESQCAPDNKVTKFEAGSMYSSLLDLLSSKSKSFESVKTRNKLVEFHGLVRTLQKHTMKSNTDAHTIKSLRDESFNLLISIYEDKQQTATMDELDDLYLTLLAINEKLVTALKHSHTGNENIISTEGCYCRHGLCALRRCSKNCVQTCLAEPVLTRFSCNIRNLTVPIETICNGKSNCPNGEDEKDCKKDICRGHHLVMLRHNLQNIGLKQKSSFLGDVLNNWRNKVSAALVIAENNERPNHKIMTDIISRVLNDLVTAFAAMEDYRRNHSEIALQEFINISKIVMSTLKSCSN